MPRQSRGPAPKRPTAAPARPAAPAQQQTRPATTAAYPPAQQQQRAQPPVAAPQQSGGSGLFGQMASTAAGVAVGSSIGHALGGFFGGGSSAAPPAESAQSPVTQTEDGTFAANNDFQAAGACATDVRNFRSCMDENRGDLTICGWYLDQLKACQGAASRY